jgi:hypothetical protein
MEVQTSTPRKAGIFLGWDDPAYPQSPQKPAVIGDRFN